MIVLADADLERAANARRLLLDVQRRADVHLASSASTSRSRSTTSSSPRSPRRSRRCARRAARPAGHGRRRRHDLPAAGRHRRAPRARTRVDKGAHVLVGGERGHEGRAALYEPTVLVDVDHDMECMTRGDIRADAADHEGAPTPRRRSAWPTTRSYGLGGSVFTKDARTRRGGRAPDRGRRGLRQRRARQLLRARAADGRREGVGLGHRHGAGGIRKFAHQQSLLISRLHPKRDLHMYPYKAKMTARLTKLVRFLYGRGKRD